ncbi:KH domain-containing protein [Campylobacter sp.]|uniref:KH domain-containing protein n=1 Tax=Campylobacter sp. TaxID=205 RepID=UPI0026DCE431|nr:KH domain-containing protein [Campylobacter sp.]MDO4673832.1 KH domain-containing protein [Campylobacter sp.]
MVENFLEEYAKLIVDYPEKIHTQRVDLGDDFVEIFIFADKADTGKLIGKNGKTINAIKTIISAYKSKEALSYRVTVKAIEES